MKSLGNVIVIAITSLTLSGCIANMNSVRHKFKIRDEKSQLIDVKQRGIFISSKEERIEEMIGDKKFTRIKNHPIVCAEPSPDAMSAYAAEMAAKGGSEGKAYGELSAAMQESASFVGMRTASIQALRDYGYRICEAYMSGAINEIQYESLLRRYQKNLVVLFTIEQLSGVNRVPTIALISQGAVGEGGIIQTLETTKKNLNNEIDQLKASKAGKTTAEQEAIDLKIQNINKDITNIEGSIKTLKEKGMSSSASIITIPTSTPAANDISTVAKNIYDLANSMIRSDEYGSLCLSLVQQTFMKDNLKPYQIEAGKNCVKYLESNASNGGVQTPKGNNIAPDLTQFPVWQHSKNVIITDPEF
ncbi:hypothetical protein Q7574_02870 [Acinetobacter pittii]|uniref:hypothetical protein n=1 Tax=Acinetobacter pittii TaxID=48296 RepID=UPI00313B49B5